ncbi:MAG: T9SS type A sorting domain-containing protein, partial [Paludibacteraceae bacterium]|nr:T9SS type A sorting domain-containing protein [Paludibacteraceae bacterium]
YVEATADGCTSSRVKATAYISGKNTTWTGAFNNDWNNAANWTEGVPCSISNTTITDVSIAPNYPIITSNTACKNIIFEPGGAVLGLQYLSYEKAFVKTSLGRNIWYTLTAPLKEMYSGDYYFNGAPETFMQLFNTPSPDAIGPNVTYEGTFTRAFASLQVPLSLGQGFAYKLSEKTWNYPFGNSNISSDLDITFPRINPDSSLLSSYIPYSAGNGMPYSFMAKTVTKNPTLAYRFAAENAANELTDITYTLEPGINLIGNPLMTHLDFNKLYLHNMAYIENKVKFWNGETFTTYITNQDLENAISSSDNTTNIIPPMQAFFVVAPTGGTLTFDLDNDFVANNSMNLRAASVKPNVLFIESDNGQMKSFAAIAKRQYAKNDFDSNDAFKLFSQHKNAPEVYTIANDMALDINQFEEFPFTVPLCIKTDSGNVTLSFNGVESFGNDVTIELINAKTGEVVDLKEENRYQYTVTPTKDEGTLFISFRNASLLTDIETIGIDHGIQIIANNQHAIKVISSPNDPIKEVLVFDVSGRKIQHTCVSNTYNVELPVFVKNEIYLVQVFTENNTRIAKVLVK